MQKTSLTRFYVIYTLFVTLANFVHPVTPLFLQSLEMPDYMFGVLYSCMSITLFLFSPFWGRLSDIIGTNNVTVISLFGYCLGQAIFMFSDNQFTLIISRLFCGIFVSGQSVSTLAYIIENSTKENQTKNITIYTTIIAITSSAGFYLGGIFGDENPKNAFFVQIVMCFFVALMFLIFIKDGEEKEAIIRKNKLDGNFTIKNILKEANPFNSFMDAKKAMNPLLLIFLSVTFLGFLGMTDYDNAFNYYSNDVLGFKPSEIGIVKAIVGIVGFIVNCTITIWISKRVNIKKALPIIMISCVFPLILACFVDDLSVFIISTIIFYSITVIYLPIIQSLVVNSVEGFSKPVLSGIYNSSKALGMIMGGFITGFAYGIYPKLPFYIALVAFFISAVISFFAYKKYK